MLPSLLAFDTDVTDAVPKPPSAGQAVADPWCTYAHIELAGMRVAVTTDFVRQIVPRPQTLARLPRREGALDGVFKLRGQVVPVVNLGTWLQLPSGTEPPHVMVLGTEGQVIGVAIDAIHGLLRVRASKVETVLHDAADDGFFSSVLSLADDGELLSVLDPLRLMSKARAWASEGQNVPSGAPAEADTPNRPMRNGANPTHTQALVRLGAAALAVPFQHVREVLTQPPVQRVFGRETAMLGMVRWRGVDVPLADPAKMLQLPLASAAQGKRLMMVLEHEGRHLALPVDGVMAVRAFASEKVQAASDTALFPPDTYAGSTTLDDGQRVLLLDSTHVLAAYGFKPLHGNGALALTTLTATVSAQEQAKTQPYIVFDMDGEWAAPMSALQEITPFPADFKSAEGSHPAITGTFAWRGKTLPVLDVRPSSKQPAGGGTPRTTTPKLMVVKANGRMAALVVNEVLALLPAHQGLHTELTLPGGERMHLITVNDPPARKSHRVLDVGALPFFRTELR